MFILLPIRTSVEPRRTPYANYGLIIVNVAIFFVTYSFPRFSGGRQVHILHSFAQNLMLLPSSPAIWQFVTYAFLHSGFLHLFGNMFFLYIFGNNVNSRVGNLSYILLFLAGAVFAGVGQALLHDQPIPVLGASGAVAAITGAYLVLYPQTLITILYWFFFFIGTLEVSALYFILFKLIIWDNIVEPRFSQAAIAYDAHLAGYAFGIAALLFLLGTGLVSSRGYDLWSMIKQWNRRRRYRDAISSGFEPFSGEGSRKRIQIKKSGEQGGEREDRITRLREQINYRINERNYSEAARLYLKLMEIDGSQVPPQNYLLDIANQFASENRHKEAAEAYEKFLYHYSGYEYSEQVELMVGLIYSRYLGDAEAARRHLQKAEERLSDPEQVKMCRDELDKLGQP